MEANQTTTAQQITEVKKTKTYSDLILSRLFENNYQKAGTITAEIKQTVKTITSYPGKSVNSNMQDNLFGNDEFNFEPVTYENTSTRVAFLDVPEHMTEEQVAERLVAASKNGAMIYQVLSNYPILTDKQEAAIENGTTTAAIIAEKQVMRYPEGSERAGELILDALNRPIYRATYFSNTSKEDLDKRKFVDASMSIEEKEKVAKDFFATDELLFELNN